MLDEAVRLSEAGRAVAPVVPGEKRPSLLIKGVTTPIPWQHLTERAADRRQVEAWYRHPELLGLGLVTGLASGHRLTDGQQLYCEILDIDRPETLERFLTQAEDGGYAEILRRLVFERTPHGGHFGYLHAFVTRSAKLAQRPGPDPAHPITLIETLNQGHFCVIAPTPGYTLVHGDWATPPLLTPEEHHTLLRVAMTYNEIPSPHTAKGLHTHAGTHHHQRASHGGSLITHPPQEEGNIAEEGEQTPHRSTPTQQRHQTTLTPEARQDSLLRNRYDAAKLSAADIEGLYRDPVVIQRVVNYLADLQQKPRVVAGKSFRAWFREETHPSAAILPPGKGYEHFVYFDHNEFDEHGMKVHAKSLPEVYFRILNTYWPGTLPRSTYLMWAVRLLVDSGVLQTSTTYFPPLPESAPQEAQRAYAGFQLLTQVRALLTRPADDQGEDRPYTESFCATWTQLSERAAHVGIMWILSKGYMLYTRLRKRMAFYVHGTKRLIQRLISAPIATNQRDAIATNQAAYEAVQAEPSPVRRPGQRSAQPRVQAACPHLGQLDYWEEHGTCGMCLVERAQRRLEEKQRLYRAPPLVELAPAQPSRRG
jgi:hypothetical protein